MSAPSVRRLPLPSSETIPVLGQGTWEMIEYDLLSWCRAHHLPIMAYSPIEQGRMLTLPELQNIASKHSATPAQVALAWLLQQEGISIIPKASTIAHVKENYDALNLHLTEQDITTLDHAFPPPKEPRPLEML